MTATGYSIDVYCDFGDSEWHFNQSHNNFSDESKRVAWRLCRRAGWKFGKVNGEDRAMCPACVKAGKKFTEVPV